MFCRCDGSRSPRTKPTHKTATCECVTNAAFMAPGQDFTLEIARRKSDCHGAAGCFFLLCVFTSFVHIFCYTSVNALLEAVSAHAAHKHRRRNSNNNDGSAHEHRQR